MNVPFARQIVSVSDRSLTARLAWFIGAVYVFLGVPDLDFLALGILHHRSIITHSVFPALIFMALGRRAGAAPIAGALIGIAVHLSCDLLSPMTGFAQIWLPEPIKVPLGPLSYLWLGANAFLAFIWARRIAARAFPAPWGGLLAAAASVIAAASYGLLNEASLLAAGVTLGIFVLSMVGPWLRRGREAKPAGGIDPLPAKQPEA